MDTVASFGFVGIASLFLAGRFLAIPTLEGTTARFLGISPRFLNEATVSIHTQGSRIA